MLIAFVASACVAAAGENGPGAGGELGLEEFIEQVLAGNEKLQGQLLATEAARRRMSAEYGAFEPALVGSAEHVSSERPNTVEQQRNLGGLPVFDEDNNLYDAALESLVPTGGRIRVGYTLRDLSNNLPDSQQAQRGLTEGHTHQYQAFLGVRLTQPLLKNGGWAVSLSALRLAAVNSDASFQEYRRQLMITISQAEAAYWNLYFAQEQLRFVDESVALAETVLSDSRALSEAGKGSLLDVMEAQSGLAIRKSFRNEALQKYHDAVGQVRTLLAITPEEDGSEISTAESPTLTDDDLSFKKSLRTSLELNPDFLVQKSKVNEEELKLGLAKNQSLPEMNLNASWGFNGLGDSPGGAWDDISANEFAAWSVGIDVRVPLAGGIRERNELAAARLKLRHALVDLQNVRTQLANSLFTSIEKVRTSRATVRETETVVQFNSDLLKSQLEALKLGKVEGRRVLEVEADLFEAKQNLAQALVQYKRALIELRLGEGSILRNRDLETTPEQLREKTMAWLDTRPPIKEVERTAREMEPVPGFRSSAPELR